MCDDLLLTVEEAARKLRLGRSTTYSLIQRGDLRSIKIGGSRRVPISDLVAFIEGLRMAALEGATE